MAESIVQVTEGSGKKLHTNSRTIGANTVEDEYILAGEPFLAMYRVVMSTTYASFATADSHVLQLMAGASLNVYVRRIRLYQHVAATTGALGSWNVMRLTTAGTGGTAFTPAPVDSTDSASGATAMSLPTVKGTETVGVDQGEAYVIQTIGASQNPGSLPLLLDFDYRFERTKSIRIPAGTANGIALKNRQAHAAVTGHVVIDFTEANF
jgi:hypothetical protein